MPKYAADIGPALDSKDPYLSSNIIMQRAFRRVKQSLRDLQNIDTFSSFSLSDPPIRTNYPMYIKTGPRLHFTRPIFGKITFATTFN